MGLLDKTNPAATRQSVIQQAWIWGVIGVAACLVLGLWNRPQFSAWPVFLPLAGLAGAALGALMECQLDDGNIDLYEIVLEVQDEFGVTLSEWEELETVDDLYRVTLVALPGQGGGAAREDEIWDRLKALLVKQLALHPEKVVPAARFYVDLPM